MVNKTFKVFNIRIMQIKTVLKVYLTLVGVSVIVAGSINWDSHYGYVCSIVLKNWKQNHHMTQLHHSWAHSRSAKDSTSYHRDTCTHRFIAALLTLARKRNQPGHPWTEALKMTMRYAYTMEFPIKNDETIKFTEKNDGNRRYYERGSPTLPKTNTACSCCHSGPSI